MEYSIGKILQFRETVVRDATKQKNDILKQIENEKKQFLEESENAVYREIYDTLQKKRVEISKQSGERISRALGESKKRLLQKREDIISEVFSDLEKRAAEFKNTPAYGKYLIKTIENSLKLVGDGEITVCIDESDAAYKSEIGKVFGGEVEYGEIIGGVRVINKTKNIICDESLALRIENLKNGFLENSGLTISCEV